MSSLQGTIDSEARRRWLEDRLVDDAAVAIGDAAAALGVSEMTIRRDLAELEARGVARRVRGGARAIGPQTFVTRHHTATRAKNRIAAKLGPLVPEDGVIAWDASSTVMRVVRHLEHVRDVTILTNGLDTFTALQGLPGVTALLTGGRRDDRTGSLVGPLACHAASRLQAAAFFASTAAIDPAAGALEATLEEAEVKRVIADGAGRVVVAVDSSKLGTRATAVALTWSRIDVLVTELDPGDPRLDPYRGHVEVL